MRYRILLYISLLLFIGSFSFWYFDFKQSQDLEITKVIDYTSIDFAGEKVSFDGRYFYNKEKLERELSITRFNVYQFVLYHKREPVYFPYIEKKLKEAGIPNDFKYLAVAESGLKNDSLSSENAGGIWQFIPDTGKRFGLTINSYVDERYNFEKSTDAAISYFKKLYKDFGNWTLVAAAYNRGENGLKRSLEDQQVKSYYDLYLNEETSRYIFRILSIKYLMISRYQIFDKDYLGEQFTSPKTKEKKVGVIADLKKWSRDNNQSYLNIKQLNAWIIGDALPAGEWTIKIMNDNN